MGARRLASTGVLLVLCTILAYAPGCGEDDEPALHDPLLLVETGEPDMPALLSHAAGDVLAPLNDANGATIGAAYLSPEAGSLIVWVDASGLPTRAHGDGSIVLLDNYGDGAVDIAIISPGARTQLHRRLPFPTVGPPPAPQAPDDTLTRDLRDAARLLRAVGLVVRDVGPSLAHGARMPVFGAASDSKLVALAMLLESRAPTEVSRDPDAAARLATTIGRALTAHVADAARALATLRIDTGKMARILANPAATIESDFPADLRLTRIIYRSERLDGVGAFVMNHDGSSSRRLSDTGRFSGWSPDGRYVLLVGHDIYVHHLDSMSESNLTRDGGEYISAWWSPDGSHIAYTQSEDIHVMDPQGGARRNLTNDGERYTRLSWSPDARQMVFLSNRDGNSEIYAMDLDGGNRRNLTNNAAEDTFPRWSPDGRHIGFYTERDGNDELYVMDADGRNPRNLSRHSSGLDWGLSWSPDGRRIAFTSIRGGPREIYVVDVDGGEPVNLTRNRRIDENPSWSPDGRYIAYNSDLGGEEATGSGQRDIFVMEADGSNPRNLTNHPAHEYSASWSPR